MRLKNIFVLWPLCAIGIFEAFWLWTWISLGRMPKYGQPDPKWIYNEPILFFIYMSFLAAVLSLAIQVLRCLRGKAKQNEVMICLGQALLFGFLIIGDPFGAMEWFLD